MYLILNSDRETQAFDLKSFYLFYDYYHKQYSDILIVKRKHLPNRTQCISTTNLLQIVCKLANITVLLLYEQSIANV